MYACKPKWKDVKGCMSLIFLQQSAVYFFLHGNGGFLDKCVNFCAANRKPQLISRMLSLISPENLTKDEKTENTLFSFQKPKQKKS